MKIYVLLLALFTMSAHSEHSIMVGLYTSHLNGGKYEDYRQDQWDAPGKRKPLNEGGPMANQLIGDRYSSKNWSAGVCRFNNTFYETTYCTFGMLHLNVGDHWRVSSGINVTHGYRMALVKQKADESMRQSFMAMPISGVSYRFKGASIGLQLAAGSIMAAVLEIGI